jgi:hypothetical protein
MHRFVNFFPELVSGNVGKALAHGVNRLVKYLPADGLFDEFGKGALLEPSGTDKGTQNEIGLLGPGDG